MVHVVSNIRIAGIGIALAYHLCLSLYAMVTWRAELGASRPQGYR
jgi:hypothetical protein